MIIGSGAKFSANQTTSLRPVFRGNRAIDLFTNSFLLLARHLSMIFCKKERARLISHPGSHLCRQRPTLPHTFACSAIGPGHLTLRRFARVSEAGARSRNPERSLRRISQSKMSSTRSCSSVPPPGPCPTNDIHQPVEHRLITFLLGILQVSRNGFPDWRDGIAAVAV